MRRLSIAGLLLVLAACGRTPLAPCPADTMRLRAVRDDGHVDTLTTITTSCLHWPPARRSENEGGAETE